MSAAFEAACAVLAVGEYSDLHIAIDNVADIAFAEALVEGNASVQAERRHWS